MASKRVSAPSRSTRSSTGACRLMLPATTSSPTSFTTGLDSPVSSASSASVRPCSNTPSAAKASPASTRTRSPSARRESGTNSSRPASSSRRAPSGSRAIESSSVAATRCRARNSRLRPPSRKNTNIVSESKYTSWPNTPPGSKVAPELAMKVTSRPSATGTSMPMRRAFRLRHAPLKKGPAANTSTGSVSNQLAHCSRRCTSGAIVPGSAK